MITKKNKEFLANYGSEKCIDKLIKDPGFNVKFNLTSNPNLQPHHIDALVDDEHDDIRASIIHHPNIEIHHLETLIDDHQADISDEAREKYEQIGNHDIDQ